MIDRSRPVYCERCFRIAQAGDKFCGVCGARITPDAQDAPPTQEIPTQVYLPSSVPAHRHNKTLSVIVGLGALLAAMLAVGAIVTLNLRSTETPNQGEGEFGPAATTQTPEGGTQSAAHQDEGSEPLDVGDYVEVRGIRTTLNGVRTLPTTELEQPVESPDNLFVATDLTFENTSQKTVAVSRLLQFVLKNEDGYSASQTTHSKQRQLVEDNIAPNQKTSGEIVYEVPPEVKELQLDYSPFAGGETYTWHIGDLTEIPRATVSTTGGETTKSEVDRSETTKSQVDRSGSDRSATTKSQTDHSESGLLEAVEDYYKAVDREEWAYTYENLDSQTRAMFTEEEWGLKNQWFADNEGLDLATMEVQVNGSPSDPVLSVSVYRTFKDGTVIDRDTFFVFEDGVWKHRFGEEEIGSFMPDASYREFVATQQGVSSDKILSTSDPDQGEEDLREAVEAYYQAAGVENWAHTYEHLDSETKSAFSKEEWFKKNQWFADNGSVIYHVLAVNLNSAFQDPVAQITLRLTDEYGSSSVRNTFFVLEDGSWKHRFGQEEYNLFMPEATYEEFVEAREGA